MVRKLKGLENVISISVVDPRLSDEGWRFAQKNEGIAGAEQDLLNGANYIHQLYTKANQDFTGKATVPILWDKQTNTIVNNESADIIQMLNSAFDEWATKDVDLRPSLLWPDIEKYNHWLYENFNNGVYQAGFSTSQAAYEIANEKVFSTLSQLEKMLQDGRQYFFKAQLTETDIRIFVTLIRFDVAYHGLFKCNLKRIEDFPYLQSYMERIYAIPGINETVNIEHIKQGYYSVKALNPKGIVPTGPYLNFIKDN
jgi:putative glutathione S-transferase